MANCGLTCADAVDHIVLSCPGFYGEVVVGVLSTFARIRVDGREAHFLKFEVLEGMYGVAEAFLEEARIRIEAEPFLQFVGPPSSSSSFRVLRPGKVIVRNTNDSGCSTTRAQSDPSDPSSFTSDSRPSFT